MSVVKVLGSILPGYIVTHAVTVTCTIITTFGIGTQPLLLLVSSTKKDRILVPWCLWFQSAGCKHQMQILRCTLVQALALHKQVTLTH